MRKIYLLLIASLFAGIVFGQVSIKKKSAIVHKKNSTEKLMPTRQDGPFSTKLTPSITSQKSKSTLNEGFEGTTFPPDGWTSVSVLGAKQWSRMTTAGAAYSGTAFAEMDYETAGGEDWLITPRLDITSLTDTIAFYMRHKYTAAYPPDSTYILVSTTDASIASFTTVIASWEVETDYTAIYQRKALSLGAYNGQQVFVAIKHVNTDGNGIRIDDVTGPNIFAAAEDAGISKIVAPTGIKWTFNTSTENVVVRVKNSGANPLTNVTINWQVNGVAQTPFAWTGNLLNGVDTPVTVGTYNFALPATYTISATTVNPNGSTDGNTLNDTKTDSLIVLNPFTVPYLENFDAVTVPAIPLGWSTETNVVSWKSGNSTLIGTQSAPNYLITSYNSTNAKNDWAYTPAIQMTAGTNYKLSFWYNAPGYAGVPEKLMVTFGNAAVSTSVLDSLWDNNNIMVTAYTEGTATFTPAVTGYYFVGFHAYSDADVDFIAIDDVSISELLNDDVMAKSIDMAPTMITNTINPKATVKNNGASTQTFDVTMTIGSYTNTQTVSGLASGAEQMVTFAPWAATAGTYTAHVATLLGTDGNHVNDTLNKTITVNNSDWVFWGPSGNSSAIGTNAVANFDVAVRFDVNDLSAYDGLYMSKVRFWPKFDTCTYTLKLWTGGHINAIDTIPGTLIADSIVTNPTMDVWNEISFTDMPISAAQEMWVGYNVNTQGGYPAGCDAGPAIDWKGNLMFYNGYWTTLKNLSSTLDYNWNIEIWVSNSPTGINAFPIQHNQIAVYPNPVNNILNISNLKNSNIAIYNVLGEIVYNANNISDNHTVNTENLANGTYLIKVLSDNKIITKKFNLVK